MWLEHISMRSEAMLRDLNSRELMWVCGYLVVN